MKRAFLILGLCVLLFSGCVYTSKIGGADGPTSILVGTNKGEINEEIEPVRMINVKGDLYFDTGISNNVPRCGTLDGKLEQIAEQYEIPRKAGGTNFDIDDDYFGYQSLSSISKDVLMDNGWLTFKKINKDGSDLSKYKYCFKITGTHPNAVKSSQYIVLANSLDITFDQITNYFFGSQIKDHQLDIVVVYPEISDEWGIRMYLENISSKGLTLCCEQFGGEYKGTLETGVDYTIETFKDGQWTELKTENPLFWTLQGILIPKNELTKWDISFENTYGTLSKGQYRIVKEITDYTHAGENQKKMYYAEFEI